MSRCSYGRREESDAAIDGLRSRGIPADVINLDSSWMNNHYYFDLGVDACDFVKSKEDFPDQQKMFIDYLAKGINTCLWINPYLPEGGEIYDEAEEKGYLLKSLNGGIARLAYGEPVGMIDFTNPVATEWWKEHLRSLFRDGASVIKPDYGDKIPEDAVGFDGITGKELHNLYLYYYTKAAYEATVEVRGPSEGFIWRRAGFIGSQRYPGTWAGDTQVSWEGLKHCMRGGLSAGMCGEAFWSSDIGGFVGATPSNELYTRWVQFGMFSSLTRFHGTTPREPWFYGDTAVAVTKHYSVFRYTIMPYLFSLSYEATKTGLPLMRHMKLEFQNEPNVETLDDQYMLGSDILVAPIINEGAIDRHIYLPEGKWYEVEMDNKIFEGGRFIKVDAPLEKIPLLFRGGAVIPKYAKAPQHLKEKAAEELILDIYAGESKRTLFFNEYNKNVSIKYNSCDSSRVLVVDPVNLRITIRLIGFDNVDMDKFICCSLHKGIYEIKLDATSGINITW